MESSVPLIYYGLAALVALVAHVLCRDYWRAVLIGALAASLVNIAHEMLTQDHAPRPADLFFWIPMMGVMGVAAALPIAVGVGIPFYLMRRKRCRTVSLPLL